MQPLALEILLDATLVSDIIRGGRNAVNSICLAVNSSLKKSHFVDLSGVFSVYLYRLDCLITKPHFTTISLFIYAKKSKLVCSSFFEFLEILRNKSILRTNRSFTVNVDSTYNRICLL